MANGEQEGIKVTGWASADRVAFDERIWLDQAGHPHSSGLHIMERFTRPHLGHTNIETTVEDPGVLSKPYTIKRTADLAQEYDTSEFIRAENERAPPTMNFIQK